MAKPDFSDYFISSTNNFSGDTLITFFTSWFEYDNDNKQTFIKEEVAKISLSYVNAKELVKTLQNSINQFEQLKD